MLRSSGPFANGSLSDKREFGRIHHVIMNQSQALLHWQNQTRAVGRSEIREGGYGSLLSGIWLILAYKLSQILILPCSIYFQIKTDLSKSGGAISPLPPGSYSPADPLQTNHQI